MNPFRKVRDAARFWKALGYYEKLKDQIEKENDVKKLLLSKRLWVSIAGLAITLSDAVPPKVGGVLMAAGAILTKIIDMGVLKSD